MADPAAPSPPASAWRFGQGPAPEVLDYFRAKGMRPSFHWTEVWQEEHATAFTVAKATRLDVLEAIRAELDRAIAEGLPFESFRSALEPRLKALGWWGIQPVIDPETGLPVEAQLGSPRRLRLIYDANLRTANAAGQWARIWRTRDLLPFLIYQHTTSAEPREEHWHWADIPVTLPVDDPWWETHFPPNGWNCKCWVIQADEEDARAAGWTPETTAPEVVMEDWTNARTGLSYSIPQGIDPGWASNPGRTRQQLVDAMLDTRLTVADPMIRAVALQDMGNGWLARKIADGSITDAAIAAPIGHVPRRHFPSRPFAGEALQSGVVWLTPHAVEVAARAKVAAPWADLPRLIDEGALESFPGTKTWARAWRRSGDGYWAVDMAVRRRPEGTARLEVDTVSPFAIKDAEKLIAKAAKKGRLLRREVTSGGLFPAAGAIVEGAGLPGAGGAIPPAPAPPPSPSDRPADATAAPDQAPPEGHRKPRRRKPPPEPGADD